MPTIFYFYARTSINVLYVLVNNLFRKNEKYKLLFSIKNTTKTIVAFLRRFVNNIFEKASGLLAW